MVALVLSGALAVIGCGDDEGNGTGGTGGGTAGTGGAGATGGTGGGTGGSGGMPGADPVITNIAWAPDGACARGTRSNYTITVTATDAENDPTELTYMGSVSCSMSGPIDAIDSTVSCPNVAPYTGMVVVEDLDGNTSLNANFTFDVCETSSCADNVTACNL